MKRRLDRIAVAVNRVNFDTVNVALDHKSKIYFRLIENILEYDVESLVFRKLIVGLCVFGSCYAMQPSSSGNSISVSVSSREKMAEELSAQISRSVPRRGFVSNVYAELEQCRLKIEVEYDRPCNEALEGQFLIVDKTSIDLRELSSFESDIRLSRYSSDLVRKYHWNFKSNVKKQMIDAGEVFLREVGRLMDAGINGANRSEHLASFSVQLFDSYGIESHIAHQTCREQPVPEPLAGGVFYLELNPSDGESLLGELLSYRNEYCEN